jgi:CHASE1-domain containing sensor protein
MFFFLYIFNYFLYIFLYIVFIVFPVFLFLSLYFCFFISRAQMLNSQTRLHQSITQDHDGEQQKVR